MKKFFILLIVLLLIVGCGKKDNETKVLDSNEKFIVEKIDSSKDYVYLEPKLEYKLKDNSSFKYNNLVVNLKGNSIDNVNLEIKSFVNRSIKNLNVSNGVINSGLLINYDYYINEDYISIIVKYFKYVNGTKGEEDDMVYVISLKNGKVLNNNDILKVFNLTEDELYKLVGSKLKGDDKDLLLSIIKNEGYDLYINKEGKLVIIYYNIDDIDSVRDELILN